MQLKTVVMANKLHLFHVLGRVCRRLDKVVSIKVDLKHKNHPKDIEAGTLIPKNLRAGITV